MENEVRNTLGKGLNIVHLNVRSLTGGHKFEMVRKQIEDSKVEVFSMSETWLTGAIPDRVVECMNYNMVRLDRSWSEDENNGLFFKKGGGVACYIRSDIKYSDTKYKELNKSCKDIEMLWISLELERVRPIVIVTIYKPPQGDYKRCNEYLNGAFEAANLKDNSDIFLLGDFNIDLGDKGSIKTRELEFTTRALGLRQLINSHTRVATREGVLTKSKIDLIFSNSDCITGARTLDYNISDHLAVAVTRKKQKTETKRVDFEGRSYRNYDREEFQQSLREENWGNFFTSRDPDELWERMRSKITEQADRFCPMRKFKVKEVREPWITNEAIEAIRDKDRVMSRAKRTGRAEDWEEARRARNRVGRDLENLRADYLKRQQEANREDPKKFWRNIASIFPGKKGKSGHIWLKNELREDVDPLDTAGYINQFFTNIGPTLAKDYNARWKYFGDTVQDTIGGFETNLGEVEKLCKEVNIMKSSGIDELSSRLCKDAFVALGEQLVHLFNCSLSSGIFPRKWKVAKIIPIFKGGDRESVNNYRPVSLLPLPGKLLEKLVHSKITSFWDTNNFLTEHQGGFRKGYSTVSTIADLTDDLFQNINEGNTTLAAFVDLRKAFDIVNTNILLEKLRHAGIGGMVLNWCKNYLSNRFQCTYANGVKSSTLPITCGVPQGSVLGPLFFLVYVNDVKNAVTNCGVKLYADDTVLYQPGLNQEEAQGKLQKSVDSFKQWCDINALTINAPKTKVMVFASRSKAKKCKNISIQIGGVKLKVVPSFKYLGLTLDSTLNYTNHIASVIRLITYKMTLLAKLKKYLNTDVATLIYKTMILPYFDYADVIYWKANERDIGKLQTLQNKCLRICKGRDMRFSVDRVHKQSNVPFLKDRRVAHVRNFMYIRKRRRDLLNTREIRTRAHDAPIFTVPIPRSEAFKRSVGYSGSVEWNSLKADLHNTNNYLSFKEKQKILMLQPLKVIPNE